MSRDLWDLMGQSSGLALRNAATVGIQVPAALCPRLRVSAAASVGARQRLRGRTGRRTLRVLRVLLGHPYMAQGSMKTHKRPPTNSCVAFLELLRLIPLCIPHRPSAL